MSIPDSLIQVLSSALGVAIVTALLGPYILGGLDRRKLKAEVLRAVQNIETNRWAPTSRDAFQLAITDLRAASLLAGSNRSLVDKYTFFAAVAWDLSDTEYELDPESPEQFRGSIDAEFSDLVRDAARAVIFSLWHPQLARLVKPITLKKFDRRQREITARMSKSSVHAPNWASAKYFNLS